MVKGASFGDFFRALRVEREETLRQFCLKNGFDAGNISRLERGRLPPPRSREKLDEYAKGLGLEEGSDDWYKFFDLAAISAGRIPPAILSDEEVVARLPLVFRTLANRQVDGDELDRLIELIRRS